jgi:DNA-binding IscR family transcriptional regulator
LEEDCYCSRHATETCPVRKFYKEMQTFMDEAFSGKTIASLM